MARILVAKPGLDGHDRGAKVIARALRDGGFEVIYTGIRQTPELIARVAEQEDVAAVGLSILSGAHMDLCERVVNELRKRGMSDVLVVVGGIIPKDDIEPLEKLGVSAAFGPGSSVNDVVGFFKERLGSRTESSRTPAWR